MPVNYGVLKGTVTGHLRDADDDHYQILVSAAKTMYRIAVNVESSMKPPDLRFQSLTSLPSSLTHDLTVLPPGYKKLPGKPGGIAQDFVRGGIVKTDKFKVVPGNRPGAQQRPERHHGRRRGQRDGPGRQCHLRVRSQVWSREAEGPILQVHARAMACTTST